MNNYFKVIDDLQAAAIAEPFVNTVTQGDITEVDLNKNTIFPLCHITINNVTLTSNICTADISIILMDIRGNNNEMDVLNTQLAVAGRLQAELLRLDTYYKDYQVDSPFTCEPFTDRFENNVAGWAVSFSITMANPSTKC